MAASWRKLTGSDTWHNCSNWPTSNYDVSTSKPTSGELCSECLGKQKAGNCS